MPPKKRGKKKCKEDPVKAQRKLKLELLFKDFDERLEDNIRDMLVEAEAVCDRIQARYALELKSIPVQFHDLTLQQITELQNKTPVKETPSKVKSVSAISAYMTKLKSMSEQRTLSAKRKKNQRLNTHKTGKKSSSTSSASNISRNMSSSGAANRKALGVVQPTVTPLTYLKSATPMNKKVPQQKRPFHQRSASLTVTPKFDPRTPLPGMLLRAPKAGEMIMSLSGSPLRNHIAEDSGGPALLLSLGDGKVLNIAESAQLNSLQGLQLDHNTKATLLSVQKKLAGILQA